MSRKIKLTQARVWETLDELEKEQVITTRTNRRMTNQQNNKAWWTHLPTHIRDKMYLLFDSNTDRRKVAREVGYPVSFVTYVFLNHYRRKR